MSMSLCIGASHRRKRYQQHTISPPLIHPRRRTTSRRGRISLQATRTSRNRRRTTRPGAHALGHRWESTGRREWKIGEAAGAWRWDCALGHVREGRREATCWRGSRVERWREWEAVSSGGWKGWDVRGDLAVGDILWSPHMGRDWVGHTRNHGRGTWGTWWRDAEWRRGHARATWSC